MSEANNERMLCDRVAEYLAQRQGESVHSVEQIDAVIRDREAVEAIYRTPTSQFAVEHTRIESFPNQIGLGKQIDQLLGPLETDLTGRLPGVFYLSVQVGRARVPAAKQASVREAIAKWILMNAATLESEEKVSSEERYTISSTPNGVPFRITLRRECDYGSKLMILQERNGDRQQLRRRALARSLERKCPKLKAAQSNGCISVLILESNDIALSNRVVVAEATAAELPKRTDQPDIVIWARTSTPPWRAAIIKDGTRLYPDVDARLFELK